MLVNRGLGEPVKRSPVIGPTLLLNHLLSEPPGLNHSPSALLGFLTYTWGGNTISHLPEVCGKSNEIMSAKGFVKVSYY